MPGFFEHGLQWVEAGLMFEDSRHIRRRVMRFQVCRLIDDMGKGGGMTATESVANELGDEVEDLVG